MHIIVLIKGNLEKNVPVITQIMLALAKQNQVSVICTNCDNKLQKLLEGKGARIYTSLRNTLGRSVIKKASDWLVTRKEFKKILNSIYQTGDLVYVGSLDSALAMGKQLLKYRYILHIRELYDKYPYYLKLIRPFAQSAKAVIVPEYCRAAMLKCWLGLDKAPIVIPNKPYDHPRERHLKIFDDQIEKAINEFRDKKILLYQGNISRDRGIKDLVRSVLKNCGESYLLVLMGTNHGKFVDELKKEYPQVYHIDYVPAPFHLQITSHAHIGLVTYDDSCLNNIFCAPNKIYEYSGFGIPIIGRDIPGLRYTIGYSKAGVCVDFTGFEEVGKVLKEIEDNYDFYSNNASDFFDSIDLQSLFDKMLKY